MATTEPRTESEVRAALHEEREALADSLDQLRRGLHAAADRGSQAAKVVPLALGALLVLRTAARRLRRR